ncbi:MAG: transketolase C-terminal domain-containing protein, partial [Oscillospiraceae bacterium]
PFAKRFKEQGRFFDVEIAEEHGVAFAGGLATQGLRPVFAVYSTFLQRSYDQIIHDLSIEPKHVVLAVDRAGIVGDDGETHQGVFDVTMLSNVPGMIIYSPASYKGLRYSLHKALYRHKGVVAVRYPRGAENLQYQALMAEDTDSKFTDNSKTNLIITYGRLITQSAEAVKLLHEQNISVSLLHLNKIYPICNELFEQIKGYENILFIEEGIKKGSIAEYVAAELLQRKFNGKFKIKAIDNKFVPQASIEQALISVGLDANSIAQFFLGGLL